MYESFKALESGKVDDLDVRGCSGAQKREWAETFRDKVDTTEVTLTGHSFGGGTLVSHLRTTAFSARLTLTLPFLQLHLLQNPPPSGYTALPVDKAIALDPWLDPLPQPSATSKPPISPPPILVINSPGFTIWKNHFQSLIDIIRPINGELITLTGSNRKFFDASFIPVSQTEC